MTGPNVWLPATHATGAVLEALGPLAQDAKAHARWRTLATQMSMALGWHRGCDSPVLLVRTGASATILALAAPEDQLMLATDVNEWAWERAVGLIGSTWQHNTDPNRSQAEFQAEFQAEYRAQFQPLHAAIPTFTSALGVFSQRASEQRNPGLIRLMLGARKRQIPVLLDDQLLTLGTGKGNQSWGLAELPTFENVTWAHLHGIPTLVVTGTNGKTTSVRLLAAMASHAGQRTGYCCTEGVIIDGVQLEAGDFSGPGGARSVLRQSGIDFAVLEMARGGILRRGLALDSAQVALITNVSPEHFGEYGIDNIHDLAQVKLVLAQTVQQHGTLVLNADDPLLLAYAKTHASADSTAHTAHSASLPCPLALFAHDYAHPALQAQRAKGGLCCGVQAGRLLLFAYNQEADLGAVTAMPLTVQGSAHYNIANCAGAALSAFAMGIKATHIAQVLSQFGLSRHDNPGRLERWDLADITVLLDYAHNPEGLSGLLSVAQGLRLASQSKGQSPGRIGLLLGQAGNRSNEAIGDLAKAAAGFTPDHIILKDILGYMRGREPGEVPALLHAGLLESGMAAQKIELILPEVEAACALLRWARAGDVLVLPVHDTQSKKRMQDLLDTLHSQHWRSGQPLTPPA